jgi:peptide/nickel transport system ATP-binding protein
MTDLIQVKDLKVEFQTQAGPVRAVEGISFRIRPGSTVAVVGESGSGKSVTAQVIMGILPRNARITQGQIQFNDTGGTPAIPPGEYGGKSIDLAGLDPDGDTFRQIRGNRISMIFQEPMTSLSPLHTIGDQISEALFLHRTASSAEGRELSIDMLRMVGFPDPAKAFETYPFELSGGLRQRAMIAMALICQPALLVADEPSTALDVTIQAQILKLIMDLQKELGMAVLIITHDLGVVANVAEEVVVVYKGEVVESGTIDDLFSRPSHPYLNALLKAVPHFDMKPGERLVPLRAIECHTAHLLAASENAKGDLKADVPLLDVKNISKTYTTRKGGSLFGIAPAAGIKAVDDVSFTVREGECLGLVGESGCGKSTLSKIIMRGMEPDGGSVLFNNDDGQINLMDYDDKAMVPLRRKIQYMFQDPFGSLNPRMTVSDIVSEPLVIHKIGDAAYRREMVTELMYLVGLDARALSRYPHSFSGGQRQRIGIARALALRPRMIICDEPVSALDVSVQAQVLNLLKDLQQELGLTYLFISHNLAVINYMADDIVVMCAGQIVETAPREVLFGKPMHPYTRALLSAVPYPDPNRKLDFPELMEGRASQPEAWPDPFCAVGDQRPQLIDLGGGHFVRATNGEEFVAA